MEWVYMLRCSDGSFYVRRMENLEFRIAQHQAGIGGDYTRKRLQAELVWSAELEDQVESATRERQIKKWSHAKKEALIRENWSEIGRLARGRNRSSRE